MSYEEWNRHQEQEIRDGHMRDRARRIFGPDVAINRRGDRFVLKPFESWQNKPSPEQLRMNELRTCLEAAARARRDPLAVARSVSNLGHALYAVGWQAIYDRLDRMRALVALGSVMGVMSECLRITPTDRRVARLREEMVL